MRLLASRIVVSHFRTQAVPLFSYNEQQTNVDALLAQALGSCDLRRDNPFRVARTTSVNARSIFGGRYEWRDRIHVRGENYCRIRLLRRCSVNVEAIVLNRNSARLIADAAEFSIKIISDGGFVARDRFDVDELASERDGVH